MGICDVFVDMLTNFICFTRYVWLLTSFEIESHRLTTTLSPKLLSLIPLAFDRIKDGCLVHLYPGIEEEKEAILNGDWKSLEMICLDLLLENNSIGMDDLIHRLEV